MHPLGAAIANRLIDQQEQMLEEKEQVAQFFREKLGQLEFFENVEIREGARCSWYALPVKYIGDVSKEKFVRAVNAEGAVEVDVPGSTCPLTVHSAFQNPGAVHSSMIDLAPIEHNFPRAQEFHDAVVKITVPYGCDRWAFAESYVNAISKVCASAHRIK